MILLGLGHRRKVGKDVVGTLLNTNHGFKLFSFASEIKKIAYQSFKWSGVRHPDWYEIHPEDKELLIPALGMTYRELLTTIGNNMRAIHEDVWINTTITQATKWPKAIITDVRFPKEVERIKEAGGICIHVKRDDVPEPGGNDHHLENFDGWDLTIINNFKTREELYISMKPLVKKLLRNE